MTIEWFPGHMATARKKAAETMAKIDIVIEVLDARLPGASSNPLIERLRQHRQRPCLKILNKADLEAGDGGGDLQQARRPGRQDPGPRRRPGAPPRR